MALFIYLYPPLLIPIHNHVHLLPPHLIDFCDPLVGGGQRSTGGARFIGLRNAQRALVRAALQCHISSFIFIVEPAASVFVPIELRRPLRMTPCTRLCGPWREAYCFFCEYDEGPCVQLLWTNQLSQKNITGNKLEKRKQLKCVLIAL
jgi:hypothetical protein